MNRKFLLTPTTTAAITGAALLLLAPLAAATEAAAETTTSSRRYVPARAGDFALRLEPGMAVPLTDPQSGIYNLGGGQTMSSSVPADTNATIVGRENNRRVELVVDFTIVNDGSK